MIFNTSEKSIAIAVFSALLLSACGGGGDSPDNSSSNADSNSSEVVSPAKPSEPSKPVVSAKPVKPSQPAPTLEPSKPNSANDVDDSDETTNPLKPTTAPIVAKAEVNIKDVESKSYGASAQVGSSLISAQRQSCGLSAVSEDDKLTKIATQHAQYIQHVFSNSQPSVFNAHSEGQIADIKDWTGSNNPFFTGISFTDRLRKAKYSNLAYGVVENISQISYVSSAGKVASPDYATQIMTKSLLAAPYHLRLLMLPNLSQTGSGTVAYTPFNKASDKAQGYVFVNASAANRGSANRTVKGIFTYPCAGVTDTNTALYNEFPSPVAGTGRDLRYDPIGQPIYVSMPSAKRIKVSNVKFRDIQRNIDVPTNLLDYNNDPHQRTAYELPNNEAFILPLTDNLKSCETGRKKGKNCGLYGNSEYRVSFDVLVDNKELQSKSFRFTTGAVNY